MTEVWVFLGVAACGGLGAVARYLLDAAIRRPGRRPYPLGTLVINLTGSALLGLLAGAVLVGRVPAPVLAVLGAGLMGGYTTFSSASQETVELLQDRRWSAGLTHSVGMLAGSVACAAVGLAVGSTL